MKKILLIISLLLLGTIVSGTPIFKVIKSFNNGELKKEFNSKPGNSLTLDLKTGASIEIESWDKNAVYLQIKYLKSSDETIDVSFEETENGIEVSSKYKNRKNTDGSIQVTVQVPRKQDLDLSTMGGHVKIDGVDGTIKGSTMGGHLDFSNLKGNINFQTMGGQIDLRDSDLDGKVKTMGGRVKVTNVTGDIDASSMGGNVIQSNVKGRSGKSIGKEVNISTMGGEISIDEAPNGAKLKTMGGYIEINKAGKFAEVETMGGNISIKEIDGWVKAKTMGGDIDIRSTGDLKQSGNDITLVSLRGDINLIIPNDASVKLELEIAYTKKYRSSKPEINTPFNLQSEESKEWDDSNGDPRKYIRATGNFNGGKNLIKIKTINGDIKIKELK
ncbi:hypothetical protein APF79_12210 [bacterium BRH_c32]|nr:MAG: hypothetical protein APF79_12210 [bacterium BRH_c32]